MAGARAAPLWGRRGLLALACGGAVAETVAVRAAGIDSALGFAAQVTGPPPFGVLHDLRWLLVYHRSVAALAWEAAVAVAFRSLVGAVLMRQAWPPAVPRPSFAVLLRRSALFTVLLGAALSPWVAFLFALAVVPVSWLFFLGVPVCVLVAVLLHHGLVAGRQWWTWPLPRSAGWVLLSFLVLTAAAAVITTAPFPLTVVAAAAAGLYNAWAWHGIVNALAGRRVPARLVPRAPVSLGAAVALVSAVALVAFQFALAGSRAREQVERSPPAQGEPVLVVAGFNTSWDGRPQRRLGHGYQERRFSYRGLGPDGAPLPYGPRDTHRDLVALARLMERQVLALASATGRKVSIVAESEGALVAKLYLMGADRPPVRRLVMLSPLLMPGRVYYPAPGEAGWGEATGWELRAVSALLRRLASFELSPDAPFVRSVLERAPLLWALMGCPVPGVDQDVFFPLADAVAVPYVAGGKVPVTVIPAFHGGLIDRPPVVRSVLLALEGRPVPRPASLRVATLAIRGAASAWHVPTLDQDLNPAWRGAAGGQAERAPSCARVRRVLRGAREAGGGGAR